MSNDFDNFNVEDLDESLDINSEESLEEATEEVESKLWFKLEKFGKKISFAKDIIALYHYLVDSSVSWHRKAIVAGALLYFIAPIDAIPDLTPLVGYLDDLGVITATLKFLGSELIPYYDA